MTMATGKHRKYSFVGSQYNCLLNVLQLVTEITQSATVGLMCRNFRQCWYKIVVDGKIFSDL